MHEYLLKVKKVSVDVEVVIWVVDFGLYQIAFATFVQGYEQAIRVHTLLWIVFEDLYGV